MGDDKGEETVLVAVDRKDYPKGSAYPHKITVRVYKNGAVALFPTNDFEDFIYLYANQVKLLKKALRGL